MVQNTFADTDAAWCDLKKFVRLQKFQTFFQTEFGHRHQAQRVVAAGGAGVGQVLRLADVDRDVLARRGVADDLTGVDLLACVDDQGAALLGVEQAVGDGVAGIKADEGAGGAGLDVAAPFLVAVEDRVHDALAVGVGQELAAIAEQAAAGHTELDAGAAVHHLHVHQDGLAGAQSGHDVALIDLGHVDDNALHRLHDLAVLLVGQNVRGADLQLIALAAHRLDQDGQVHFAAAHDAEGIVRGGILDLQGDVLQQLTHQAVTDLAGGDVLALLAGKRGIVDREGHFHRGIVDLDKGCHTFHQILRTSTIVLFYS